MAGLYKTFSKNYFLFVSPPGKGCSLAGNVAVFGLVDCAGTGTFSYLPAGVLVVVPLEMKKVDVTHSTAITAAKIHVPFSSTSVVCLTPMN